MSARVFLILVEAVGLGLSVTLALLSRSCRKRPLPAEVDDVYDSRRWSKFCSYAQQTTRAGLAHRMARLGILAALLWLIPYADVGRLAGHNPYVVSIVTLLIFSVANTCESYRYGRHLTLGIRQRFGLNRLTPRSFMGSYASQRALSFAGLLAIVVLTTFAGEHLRSWTRGYSIRFGQALLASAALFVAVGAVLMLLQLVNYLMLRVEYHFEPLPDGDLRRRIEAMIRASGRKVSQVYVYDESTRSTTKNAFLLRVLWHREIGIADNFLQGNSERQLLAVLSHEIGHLKHRAGWHELASVAFVGCAVVALAWLVTHPQPLWALSAWTRSSFGIVTNNYFLLLMVLGGMAYLPSLVVEAATNAASRRREMEADLEVVRYGYGEDLIVTLKRIAADQLACVSPHPVVEFWRYDHPSLLNRIRNIRAAETRLAQELVRGMDFDWGDERAATASSGMGVGQCSGLDDLRKPKG